MTQVRPTNTPPPAKHVPEPGRIVLELAAPFAIRPKERNKTQVKSSSATEDSSDEQKRSADSERVLEMAAAFSNNNDDGDGNGGDGAARHGAEADIAPPAPLQPAPVPADVAPAPATSAPPVQNAAPSSEEDEIAAELATLGEDPGIFELMFPGGAQMAVAIEASSRGLSFFLSTNNGPLGKKLKSKKKELATSLERRIGRTLNLIVL